MKFGPYTFSPDSFPIIAGPCVIESKKHVLKMARLLAEIRDRLNLQLIFKASFDKANRSLLNAYRGIWPEDDIPIFKTIREEIGLPVLTDIHIPWQAENLREVIDIIQIPAFLCRQTDLLIAAAQTDLAVNVKKGQFFSPYEISNIIEKLVLSGCKNYAITERGTCFGYNNLVVDIRAISIMQKAGVPVIFDATHSAKPPGGRQFIPTVARAAVAAGCDGLSLEVHDQPDKALSDSTIQWPLDQFEDLIVELLAFRKTYLETRK